MIESTSAIVGIACTGAQGVSRAQQAIRYNNGVAHQDGVAIDRFS